MRAADRRDKPDLIVKDAKCLLLENIGHSDLIFDVHILGVHVNL